MSFPSYSTIFKLGLLAGACSPSSTPAPPKERKPAKHALRSFLKLDAPAPPPRVPSPRASPSAPHLGLPGTPLVHRRSRDSLRAHPAKPAPQGSLPPAPGSAGSSPVLPASPSPVLFASPLPAPAPALAPAPAPVPASAPTPASGALGLVLVPAAEEEATEEAESAPRARRHSSALSRVSSIASPRRRHASRSAALAALEGRTRAPAAPKPRARNFMSMSDDEDEAEEEDEEDAPAPLKPSPSVRASRRTTLSLAYALAPPAHPVGSFFELDEDERPARALALGRSFIDIEVSAF